MGWKVGGMVGFCCISFCSDLSWWLPSCSSFSFLQKGKSPSTLFPFSEFPGFGALVLWGFWIGGCSCVITIITIKRNQSVFPNFEMIFPTSSLPWAMGYLHGLEHPLRWGSVFEAGARDAWFSVFIWALVLSGCAVALSKLGPTAILVSNLFVGGTLFLFSAALPFFLILGLVSGWEGLNWFVYCLWFRA